MKNVLYLVALFMVGTLIWSIYKFNFNNVLPVVTSNADVKNISYKIDGETFNLQNGVAIKEIAPGSATKQTVRMFGEPVYGDLNGDEKDDAAVMLSSDTGGSGTFYYAVLAIATGTTYISTNSLLLGDRIAPQTVEIHNGRALYNYVERKSGEPMTTRPSMGKSLWINYDSKTNNIGEWVKDFEGEADPNRMSLSMKKWDWVKTIMNDGKVTTPNKSGIFSITFTNDGKVKVSTDCNGIGGEYSINGNKITFSRMISTMMYCNGSQEQTFSKDLNNVQSYLFTSRGELVLEMKMDSGTIIFR